ncbi:MAG: ABC-ATPase domain-containing protein, partial [Desulfobacteraceae bacterium]
MNSVEELRRTFSRIDGRGYKAYKDLEGAYDFGQFSLHVDHVQGDPFAAPSKVRVRVPMSRAALPPSLFPNKVRQMAFEDFLARKVQRAIYRVSERVRGSGKSGLIDIDAGGQEVLERTACKVTSDWVEARIYVGLPAAGRRILGRQAEKILCDQIPKITEQGLVWQNLSHEQAKAFADCV